MFDLVGSILDLYERMSEATRAIHPFNAPLPNWPDYQSYLTNAKVSRTNFGPQNSIPVIHDPTLSLRAPLQLTLLYPYVRQFCSYAPTQSVGREFQPAQLQEIAQLRRDAPFQLVV